MPEWERGGEGGGITSRTIHDRFHSRHRLFARMRDNYDVFLKSGTKQQRSNLQRVGKGGVHTLLTRNLDLPLLLHQLSSLAVV